jgi:hypothetical protein
MATSSNFDGISDALEEARRRATRYPALAEPGVVLSELEAWLEDERQWASGYSHQWTSLLDDLGASHAGLGKHLQAHMRAGNLAAGWQELSALRGMLKGKRRGGGPDPVVRRRLMQLAVPLRAALLEVDALLAAWQDLCESSTTPEAQARARNLATLLGEAGHDPEETPKELEQVLADSAARVAALRGEPVTFGSWTERAEASEKERLELCRQLLSKPSVVGDVVIWLRYLLAPLEPGTIIKVSEGVSIYAQRTLREAWIADDQERLPPELRNGERPHNLATMARLPDEEEEEEGTELWKDPDEGRPPHALIRIDLGRVPFAEAQALARETAELLVSLAVLHGADPSIWLLTGDYASFRDGKASGASFTAPPVFEPTFEQDSAMRSDRLPFVLSQWAEKLGPHLPLTRPDLRRAAQLAYWMRRAQESWEPGRLVLYDRVFEQVAGWAGFTELDRFLEDCLRPSWPLNRIRNEITNCWSTAHSAATGPFEELSEQSWKEITDLPEVEYVPREDGGWEVNLKGVLLRLGFILKRLEPESALHERIVRLRERTASPKATQTWLKELDDDFVALRTRTRRLRNALVHGGPVGEDAARSVLPFAEWLATDALHTALDGLLADKGDLIDHFLSRRGMHLRVSERLRAGEAAAEVLFWEAK